MVLMSVLEQTQEAGGADARSARVDPPAVKAASRLPRSDVDLPMGEGSHPFLSASRFLGSFFALPSAGPGFRAETWLKS
jgi:hypothetical protein